MNDLPEKDWTPQTVPRDLAPDCYVGTGPRGAYRRGYIFGRWPEETTLAWNYDLRDRGYVFIAAWVSGQIRGADDRQYYASELAREQTLENLAAFSEKLHSAYCHMKQRG